VNLERIELSYTTARGEPRVLAVAHPPGAVEVSGTDAGVGLSVAIEYADRGLIASATIANRSRAPIRLASLRFHIATGFDASAPARMFKHGYQSWSASGPIAIGAAREHPRDSTHFIIRLNHQSEVVRPADAPETATSEMFIIVESAAAAERVLAGFLGAARAFATFTALSPDAITARALLDGVELPPGESRAIEPLYFTSSRESAAQLASRWAARLGDTMRARAGAPFQRGWCSWYHYFHAITEDALRENLRALAAMRSEFPIDVVQLDDGFQSALGDWETTNSKFPSGLARLAGEIRAAGFAAGIWTAPFLAARDSLLMRDHPDWFIRHEGGEPLRAGYNSNWTSDADAFAYALDPSHPRFRDHLAQLYRRLTADFGYSYLKLDFLYAGAAEGLRHDPNLTRAEMLRGGLEAIRSGAGERAFILGCGCPLGPAVGIVDGMRIGPDVSPYWGGEGVGDPSTVHALDAIIARSFMHRRLWLNDPDCLMLRARETRLSADERGALAATIAASGGMFLISDDMNLLDAPEAALFRDASALAQEVDAAAARGEPVLAADLLRDDAVRALVQKSAGGAVAMVLNRGDSDQQVRLADLDLGAGPFTAAALGKKPAPAAEILDLPPHSARIVRAPAA
jgi:alpha-galactosidase